MILLNLIFINIIFIYLLNKSGFFAKLSNKPFLLNVEINSKHKIHTGNIPRAGGLLLLIFLSNSIYLTKTNYFNLNLILCLLPFFIIGLFEDIFKSLNPRFRIFMMFISGCFFIFLFERNYNLPFINFIYLDFLNNSITLKILFFNLCFLVLLNGLNFIDGLNGLLIITSLSILLSINIAFDNQIFPYSDLVNFFIYSLLIIFLFNFPIARIFMGDLGAYIIGIFLCLYTLLLFSQNPNIRSEVAAIIFFYPIFEVLFSILRKLYSRKNPFMPDKSHMHTLLFFYVKKRFNNSSFSNSFSTLLITPLVFYPTILIYCLDLHVTKDILLALISCILLYFSYYYLINKKIRSFAS